MKKLLLISLILPVALAGCASWGPGEFTQINKTIAVGPDAYEKSVSCAMDLISVPAVGPFFSYNSEKNESWALTYQTSISWAGLNSDTNVTMRSKVQGENININFSNPQVFSEYGTMPPSVQGQVDSLNENINNMIFNFESCVAK